MNRRVLGNHSREQHCRGNLEFFSYSYNAINTGGIVLISLSLQGMNLTIVYTTTAYFVQHIMNNNYIKYMTVYRQRGKFKESFSHGCNVGQTTLNQP